MPDAAAAGTPMPGWVESPHLYSPLTGVCGPGKVPVAALMAAFLVYTFAPQEHGSGPFIDVHGDATALDR